MVQFTSSDGFLTINVPREWRESTTEASEVYSTLMGDSVSGLEVPAAWDLDGGAFLRGASVVVITHSASPLEADQEVAAEQAWAAFEEIFAGAEFDRQDDLITADGHNFERLDLVLTTSAGTVEQINMVAVFDGVGIEIAVILVGDALGDKDEVIEALETMVFT